MLRGITLPTLQIGELAATVGVNPKTIRYYEDIGLLSAPQRTAAGYRLYGAEDVERLRFIGKAKAIGLTIEQLREILALRAQDQAPCAHVLSLINEKLSAVERQIQALSEFRQDLLSLRDQAAQEVVQDAYVCGIIEQYEPRHEDPSLLRVR